MLLARFQSRDEINQPLTILLQRSHAFCRTALFVGLGRVLSTKIILFLAVKPMMTERFQSP